MKQLFTIILIFVFQNIHAQKEMQVNASELNVRTEPNEDSEILGVLKRNDIIETYESSNGWTKIEFQGNKDCYVSSEFIVEPATNQELKSEKELEKNGSGKFWASVIIVSTISIFLLFRISTFFVAIFGKSSSGTNSRKSVVSEKSLNEVQINELKNFDSYGRFQVYDEIGNCISHGALSSHEELLGFTEQFYITIDNKHEIKTYDPHCKLIGKLRLGRHEKYHNCVGGNFSTNTLKKRRIYDKHAHLISEKAI